MYSCLSNGWSELFIIWNIMSSFGPPSTRKTLVIWSEFSRGPPTRWGAGALALWRVGETTGLVHPGQETALEGPKNLLSVLTGRLSRKRIQALQSGMAGGRVTKGTNLIKRDSDQMVRKSQAVEQVSQRGCAVSILGGFQGPTGQSPEQPDLSL